MITEQELQQLTELLQIIQIIGSQNFDVHADYSKRETVKPKLFAKPVPVEDPFAKIFLYSDSSNPENKPISLAAALAKHDIGRGKINTILGNIGRKFIAADNEHLHIIDEALDIDATIKAIQNEAPGLIDPESQAKVNQALATIKQNPGPDGETGLNLHDLLRRTWQACNDNDMTKTTTLLNLTSNIEQGGGCPSGIAGRLVQAYASALYSKFEEQHMLEQVNRFTM